MPASRDVGKNYREMKRNHPDWPEAKLRAASLNMARERGANIPPPKRGKKDAEEGATPAWDGDWTDDELWEIWGDDSAESESLVSAIVRGVKEVFAPPPPSAATISPASLFAEAKEMADGNRFLATKDTETGRPRLTFWVSNHFRDRDNPPEILSSSAHQDFVRWAGEKDYHPEAWLWHEPGTRWGTVDWMDYFDGFLVESVLADKGMEEVALAIATDPDIGVSHGYVIPVGGRSLADFSVIERYRQYEMSPLPAGKAANALTGVAPWDLTPLLTTPHPDGTKTADSDTENGVTAMPMTPEKRDWLEAKLGKERVAALEGTTLDLANVAKALGLEAKDLADALAPSADTMPSPPSPPSAPPSDPPPAPVAAAAPSIDAEAVVKAIEDRLQLTALNELLTKMGSRLDTLEQGQAKAVGDAIRPPASQVQYLWGRSATKETGNVLSPEQSDALGAPKSDEDQLPPQLQSLKQLVMPALAGPNGQGHSGPNDALSH